MLGALQVGIHSVLGGQQMRLTQRQARLATPFDARCGTGSLHEQGTWQLGRVADMNVV